MKPNQRTSRVRVIVGTAVGLTLAVVGIHTGQAYDTYDAGCNATGCHGDFRGTNSPKGTIFSGSPANNHNMHRNVMSISAGDASCVLCHTSPDDVPVYIGSSDGVPGTLTGMGCSGCHVGTGLRKHHAAKGVTGCYTGGVGCHGTGASDNPPKENVISPYYYGKTAYTRVQNPSNTLQVANTNENWSVGDFVGTDNDGNGLADLADYSIGPFRVLSTAPEGSNLRVTFLTAGGRTNTVQAAGNVTGTYTNLSSAIRIAGVGVVTTNYLEVGGANKAARFYRIKSKFP